MPDSDQRTALPSVVLSVLLGAVVLVFWPYALDQFVLPKQLVLLVGAPAALGVLLGHRALRGEWAPGPRGDRPLVALVAAFTGYSVVAPCSHAANRELHLLGAGEAVVLAVVYAVALLARWSTAERGASRLVWALALPAALVAPFALLQGCGADPLRRLVHLSSSLPGRWQVLTTLGNPTWTAEVMAVSAPFVLMAVGFGRGAAASSRWIRGAAMVLVTSAVAVTGSRGGLLALAVGSAALWILRQPALGPGRRVMLAALVALVVVGLGAAFAWAAGVSRWGEVEPVTGRMALWAAGGALTAASPVTGHGLRHTVLVLPEGLEAVVAELDPGLHPWLPTVLVDRLDNDWLQVAVERGSPAVVLLLALWWRAALLAWRRLRQSGAQLDRAILAALAALGSCSLMSAPLHTPATAAYFWVLAGLAGVEPGAPAAAGGGAARRRWPWVAAAALGGAAAVMAGAVALEVHAANCQAGAGHRLLRAGQLVAAADRLRAPLRVVPWLTAASVDRARALVATGQAAESLVVVADGERWAASEWFWVVRSRALSQLGYPDRARRVLEEALRIVPRSSLLLEARDQSQP